MKVIKFPGAAQSVLASPASPPKQRLHHKLLLGSASFTCSVCFSTSDLSTHGMVFRTIEFYCNSCGAYYKMTNPAFGQVTSPSKKR